MHEGLWTEVEPSQHPHEREALDFVRRRLPAREPWRAWSNFTFIDASGRPAEVDLLVVAPRGVFLVEIKSYPDGVLEGDARTWRWTPPDRPLRSYDNPFLAADLKAKRLKGLLTSQRALRTGNAPRGTANLWVEAVVFLSSPHLDVKLGGRGRTGLFGPDAEEGQAQANTLAGLIAHLEQVDAARGAQVDRPLSAAIARAMEQADIRQSERYRRVASYELVELLDEGDTWQDYRATHRVSRVDKRVRIHLRSRAADDEERTAIDRAAEREFRLLSRLRHPGIETPESLEPNPLGLAMIYPYDAGATRLDHWVDNHVDADLGTRLTLVRTIAETVAHAHEHGLAHRALTPRHVWLTEVDGVPVPHLRGWTTVARDVATTASTTTGSVEGTRHPGHLLRLAGADAGPYLAPELRTVPEASGRLADVFALGALAHLVITGVPPAADADALQRVLDEHGSVPLSAAMDAASSALADVVSGATTADVSDRFPSVTEFLAWLELAEDDLTAPAEVDLLTAGRGTEVAGWTIRGRLGAGASSVVLLAERDGVTEVLKVARDADHAERLRSEYEVLSRLRHHTIIPAYGIAEIGSHTALRLKPGLLRGKGDVQVSDTLAARLRDDGPPTIDLLQRWGTDLLDALVELEREGVDHRDIKPENLVFIERGQYKERHLALIDFSLARAPETDLDAGTIGYLDPFLPDRPDRRWDGHAERYAAAVVLAEMAAGERPRWGEGADPRSTDLDVPDVRTDAIDPAIREPLVTLLHTALHRDVEQRFDTADDMRRAWERVFSGVDTSSGHRPGLSADELDLSGLDATTPIAELGLAPRLAGAVERLGVADVGGLARAPLNLSGIGAAVRRELRHLVKRLRDEGFAEEPEAIGELGALDVARASVDKLAERLVPPSNLSGEQRRMLAVLLGLEPDAAQVWPTIARTAEVTGVDRADIAGELERARRRWAEHRPELVAVREELAGWLAARGGVATGRELATVLLARRGSTHEEPDRSVRARAVVRACVEAETRIGQPRFRATRVADQLVVALDRPAPVDGHGLVEWAADPLVEVAAALGERADELVAAGEVVGPAATVAALRVIDWPALPAGVAFDDLRLAQLAAAASARAAVSSRGELYARGMPAVKAAEAGRLALLGRGGVSEQQVRERVRARFPQAEPLPERPELDRVLAEAEVGLEWDADAGRYVLAEALGAFSGTASRGSTAGTRYATLAEADAEADDLDRRVERLRSEGGFLAATVDRRNLDRAARTLGARLGALVLDLDRELVAAMRAAASAAGADWRVLLDADACPPSDARFRALKRLVDRAAAALDERVRAAGPLVVALDAGLLARYGRFDLVERWRDDLTRALTRDEATLKGLILVVPSADRERRPVLDGTPVPVATAGQWARVPTSWLDRAAA
jgi:serine/threonine protein kinase